jgi:DtxR family Mn-dependent transcriptional regulator
MSSPQVSRVVEDYVTLIWKLTEWPGASVTTSELASRLEVTPSTVSSTLKRLARDGFITYEPYGPFGLTPRGEKIAVRMVRRHRLLETFLVSALGMRWDEVHVEADRMEHSISDTVLERIDAALDHPTRDPHGDPIPDGDGQVDIVDDTSLATAAVGVLVRITRVSDHVPELLRYFADLGLYVGTELTVEARSPAADILRLNYGSTSATLGMRAASDVYVEPV